MRRRTPEDTDASTPSRTARTYQHDIAIHGCMHECMPTLIIFTLIVASRGATRELATAQQIDMSKLSCIRTYIYIGARWVTGESWKPCIQAPRLKLTRALL